MSWKILQIVSAVAVLMADVAQAETETWVFGEGTNSCGKLIAAAGSRPPGDIMGMNTARGLVVEEYAQYLQWLMGFVSGFNSLSANKDGQQVKGIDRAGMDLWMRNWCNKHPTQTVFDGAQAFINEMLTNAAARH
jgi:hypothetical protein